MRGLAFCCVSGSNVRFTFELSEIGVGDEILVQRPASHRRDGDHTFGVRVICLALNLVKLPVATIQCQ